MRLLCDAQQHWWSYCCPSRYMWQYVSLKRRSDAQTHFRRLTPTELRHSSIAATWYVEQRRCTGRRPPRCSSCFFQTVFKIIYKNCSSNIGVSCCVQIQLEGTSVGNVFLIEKEKNAGRPFPFQNTFSFFRQPCYLSLRAFKARPLIIWTSWTDHLEVCLKYNDACMEHQTLYA